MEAGFIVLGRALARDGPVLCFVHALWRLGRKMRRVARPSAGCESAALAMVADAIIWYEAIIHEWWFGGFNYSPFLSGKSASLTTPFERPSLDSGRPVPNQPQQVQSEYFNVSCGICNSAGILSIDSTVWDYRSIFYTSVSSREVHALLLTDCINAYQAAQNYSFRMDCKMAKMHLSFIRELLPFFNLSFFNAGFNIADVGTKQRGNLTICYQLLGSNRLAISFASRKEYRTLSTQ